MIASAVPAAVVAADAPRVIDVTSGKWWVTISVLQVAILIAYGASSLPKWARWEDGSKLDRLTIAQGVLVSVVAGNVAWALTYHASQLHEAICWVSAVLASYGGDAYLSKRMNAFMGRTEGVQDANR